METANPVSPSTTDVWQNTCSCICRTLGLHGFNTASLMVPSSVQEGTQANGGRLAAKRRALGPAAGSAAGQGQGPHRQADRQAPARCPTVAGGATSSSPSLGGAGPGRAGHVQCLHEIFASFAFFSFPLLPCPVSRPGCPSPSETVPG